MFDITLIMEIVISLIGALITIFVLPFIRSKTNTSQLAQLKVFANLAVGAAEQMKEAGLLDISKLDYAYNQVQAYMEKAKITFDTSIIRAAIEDEVLKLKKTNIND